MRLPIDRSFTLRGIGTVVTGTLWSGTVRAGDRLAILPSGREVRVRSVQVHDAPVETAAAGQRVAVALVGVDRDQVARGDTLAAPGSLTAGYRLECEVEVLADAPHALRSGERVTVHHATTETPARVAVRGRRRDRAGPDRAGAAAAAAADRGAGGRSRRDPADGPAGDGGGRGGDRPGTLAQRPRAGAATAGGCTRHTRAVGRGRRRAGTAAGRGAVRSAAAAAGRPGRRRVPGRRRPDRARRQGAGLHEGSVRPGAGGGGGDLRPSTARSRWPSCATASAAPAATPRRCSRRSTRTA